MSLPTQLLLHTPSCTFTSLGDQFVKKNRMQREDA